MTARGIEQRLLELLPSDSCHDFHPFLCMLANESSEAETFFGLFWTLYLIFSTKKKRESPKVHFCFLQRGDLLSLCS